MNKLIVCLWLGFATSLLAVPAHAESGPDSASPAPGGATSALAGWRRAQYGASKLLIASARSIIERWPAGDGGPDGLLRVTTSMRYLGKEARLHHAYSVQPKDGGLPARWLELDPGKRARETTVSGDGALALRRFGPPPGKDPPWAGSWTEGGADRTAIKTGGAGGPCRAPVDPWALLGRLDCLVAPGEVRLLLLSNDGGHEVIARRKNSRRQELTLVDLETGAERTVALDVWRVELLPAPGEPDPSFFGMDGGISLWIDGGSGLAVEISGRRGGIPGTIRFRLNGVSMRSRPRPAVPWPMEATSALTAPPP